VKAEGNGWQDESVVKFTDGATSGWDPEFDAKKLYGLESAPQLFTMTPVSDELSINSLPFNGTTTTVPLNFILKADKPCTLTFSETESFAPQSTIYLEDKLLARSINLKQQNIYSFDHLASNDPARFLLHFNNVTGMGEASASESGRAFISNGRLCLEIPSMQGYHADVALYNVLGQQIASRRLMMNGVVVTDAPQSTGVFVVTATSAGKYFVTKVINK
jgi:hypothetical protein